MLIDHRKIHIINPVILPTDEAPQFLQKLTPFIRKLAGGFLFLYT